MDAIQKLAQLFAEFPGIGSRQSKRFVYFLLHQPKSYTNELIATIESLKANVIECISCHRYFADDMNGETVTCKTCKDPARDNKTLLIVEKDGDLESFERSHIYKGHYFVLGGTMQILEKEPSKVIRIKELFQRVDGLTKKGLEEVIIATSITPESEHTGEYVHDVIKKHTKQHPVRISYLGRGLSSGSELEYADPDTLRHALEGRTLT
jgi:recombination protein RecR